MKYIDLISDEEERILSTETALLKEKMKRNQFLKMHPYSIYQSGNKWCTTLPCDNAQKRRIVRRKTQQELEEVIIDFYKRKTSFTLKTIYNEWLEFRYEKLGTSQKTINCFVSDWNTFFKHSVLATIPMKEIKAIDIINFFRSLTKERSYTAKRIGNVKGMLNSMFSYAIEIGIVQYNPIRDVNFKQFKYKATNSTIEYVYTQSDVNTLLSKINNMSQDEYKLIGLKPDDIYRLAIILMFNLFCRIGELKAIKWSDIDFKNRTVFLHAQILESRVWKSENSTHEQTIEYVNRIKGNTSAGARYQYLTDEAIRTLHEIKKMNISDEFVFMTNNHFISTKSFNRHLKKYCELANIKYYSSHKIRFYNASVSYTGDNLVELQSLMGHSQSATTLHYLRNVNKNNDLAHSFCKLGLHESTNSGKNKVPSNAIE